MTNFFKVQVTSVATLFVLGSATIALAQPADRGSAVVYPTVFDQSGTKTSRAAAETALNDILKKGGFKLQDSQVAARVWKAKGMRTPTSTRPQSTSDLTELGKAIGVRYVVATTVSFHTRSIWVNLGPKTVSTCSFVTTIVDSKTGKVVHEADTEGRSDEKSDTLKVVGSLLVTPLVSAVSGGPKTPYETRAAQIAAARALEKFVTVTE
jgi:hypothetical protein